MILLLIISSWGLLVSVVVGACVAARRGDVQQEWSQEPVRQLAGAGGTAH
jgi:hypothetical protein